MPGGRKSPWCLYKVTKIPAQFLTAREKIGDIMRCRCYRRPSDKKITWRDVKFSATFSGNPGKSEENRDLDRCIPMNWLFHGLDKMEFILFLCIEIDSQGWLQGVQFTYIITEPSDEPQSILPTSQEYIINLENQILIKTFTYPSVEFNTLYIHRNCWPNDNSE